MTINQPDLDEVIAEHHKDNPWSVKKANLESLLESAVRQEAIFFGKKLVTCYQFPNQFTIITEASVIEPKKFDLEIGRSLCYERALHNMWELEGYVLQCKKFEAEGCKPSDIIPAVLISGEIPDTQNLL